MHEVADSPLVGARAGQFNRVAVAVDGEQHRIAQQAFSMPGARVTGGRVVPVADEQDRGLGPGVPRAGVAVSGVPRPVRRARSPRPPAQDRSPQRARVREVADDLGPRTDRVDGASVGALDRGEPPGQPQPSAEIDSAGPLAFTTPTGHDTPVPWSGQYPRGFYCLKDTAGGNGRCGNFAGREGHFALTPAAFVPAMPRHRVPCGTAI